MLTTDEVIEKIRAVGRVHGWAIGVHGTLKRDIDLIGVPWTDNASKWEDFFFAVQDAIGKELGNVTQKPHGRMAFLILQPGATFTQDMEHVKGPQTIWNPPAIDLSLIDPRTFKKVSP